MHINQLIYFSEVVRSKSINAAAKKLFIAQPSLSASINALEKELGAKLLIRTKSGILPTPLGKKIYEEAQTIIGITNNWFAISADLQTYSGEIHLLTTPSASNYALENFITEMQSANPALHILVHEAKHQNILVQLNSSLANIAIGAYHQDEKSKLDAFVQLNDLAFEILWEDTMGVLISSKHPLAQQSVLNVKDLNQFILAYYAEDDDPISGKYFRCFFNPVTTFRLSNRERIFQVILDKNAAGIFPLKSTMNDSLVKNNLIKFMPIEDCPFIVTLFTQSGSTLACRAINT